MLDINLKDTEAKRVEKSTNRIYWLVKDFKVLGGLENRENVGSSREMLTEEDREIIRLLSEVLEDGLTEQDWLGMTPEERQELRETINDTYHFEG